MHVSVARPYNTYGPRDHFDGYKGHVIPALIKRIFDGENPLKVWGNGSQSRSFLYVEDLARGLILLTEQYPKPDPINLGTEEEIRIRGLVFQLLEICRVETEVLFDTSKPS